MPSAPATINNIKDLARKARTNDGIILFLGAGFSTLAGLPDFTSLKAKMKSVIENDVLRQYIEADDMEGLMSALRSEDPAYHLDTNSIYSLLQDELRIKDSHYMTISKIMEYLFLLPVRCVITTNYDELIEECCRRLAKAHRKSKGLRLKTFSDFLPGSGSIPIFKIHGDIHDDDLLELIIGYKDKSISIKEKDRDGFLDVFSFLISQYPILYIGYSLRDEFTKTVIERTAELSRQNNMFCIVKNGDGGIDPGLAPYVKAIGIDAYEIEKFEAVAQSVFYEYYANDLDFSVLNYDLQRLKQKLDIDFTRFTAEGIHNNSNLLKTLGYVLFHSGHAESIPDYFRKAIKAAGSKYAVPTLAIRIDLSYLSTYKSLYEFQFTQRDPNEIISDLKQLLVEIDAIEDPGDENAHLEISELRNTVVYNLLVVTVLSMQYGANILRPEEVGTYFDDFHEPLSALLRMKRYKYLGIYHLYKGELEEARKNIIIAKYHAKYIPYKREKLLILMNEQGILVKVHLRDRNFGALKESIKALEGLREEFGRIDYKYGMHYSATYMFEACVEYLKHQKDQEVIVHRTIAARTLSGGEVSGSVKKLFNKLQDEAS